MRRLVMIALSASLLLGLPAAVPLRAQNDAKKDDAKKDETKKDDAKSAEAKPKEETKGAAAGKAEAPLPTIPPEVEAKLEAARKAVAEAIVAAQDAGLVETSIDPPPILDILITGRATDQRELKKDPKDRIGVSPEVFAAWFTGYGKMEGITPERDVRIVHPSKGLKTLFEQRALVMNRYIEAAQKAKGESAKPKDESKKEEARPKDESKKEEAKPKEESKKEEAKPEEESKKEEAKPKEESKKEEAKDEGKKDEPK